jgi:hypothetical protein
LRHIALNLLRREDTAKISIRAKRKKAGWDNDYLLKVPTAQMRLPQKETIRLLAFSLAFKHNGTR